jgi:uncharacterized membrane protein
MLAGMVIGALGVLDDVAVTQASAVMAIKRANRQFGFAELFRRGLSVGRDHVAAPVNTLVLAYVGASRRSFSSLAWVTPRSRTR